MEEDDIVVEIRGGTRPPFWFLHPSGGNVLYARALARHLPADQPLLGLHARGLNGRSAPFISVLDAARYYLALVRRRQPQGPYLFGGPTFGGSVAYEMACMLLAGGEQVAMLALFDAFAPNYPSRTKLYRRAKEHALSFLHRRKRLPEGELRTQASLGLPITESPASNSLRTLERVAKAHEHALRTYHASRYPGTVHLFRASSRPDRYGVSFADHTNGWAHSVRGTLHVTTVAGTHEHLLEPPAVVHLSVALADKLRGLSLPEANAIQAHEPLVTPPPSSTHLLP